MRLFSYSHSRDAGVGAIVSAGDFEARLENIAETLGKSSRTAIVGVNEFLRTAPDLTLMNAAQSDGGAP